MATSGRVAAAVLLALLGWLPAVRAQAAPPRAPLRVAVSPDPLHAGASASLTLQVQSYLTPEENGTVMDVYIERTPGSTDTLRHLWPTGVWSTAPGPYLRVVRLDHLGDVPAAWSEEGPAGPVTLTVRFVRPGADPSDSAAWIFRPVVQRVRVESGRASPRPWLVITLAAGGVVLVGGVIVLLGRRRRPPAGVG